MPDFVVVGAFVVPGLELTPELGLDVLGLLLSVLDVPDFLLAAPLEFGLEPVLVGSGSFLLSVPVSPGFVSMGVLPGGPDSVLVLISVKVSPGLVSAGELGAGSCSVPGGVVPISVLVTPGVVSGSVLEGCTGVGSIWLAVSVCPGLVPVGIVVCGSSAVLLVFPASSSSLLGVKIIKLDEGRELLVEVTPSSLPVFEVLGELVEASTVLESDFPLSVTDGWLSLSVDEGNIDLDFEVAELLSSSLDEIFVGLVEGFEFELPGLAVGVVSSSDVFVFFVAGAFDVGPLSSSEVFVFLVAGGFDVGPLSSSEVDLPFVAGGFVGFVSSSEVFVFLVAAGFVAFLVGLTGLRVFTGAGCVGFGLIGFLVFGLGCLVFAFFGGFGCGVAPDTALFGPKGKHLENSGQDCSKRVCSHRGLASFPAVAT